MMSGSLDRLRRLDTMGHEEIFHRLGEALRRQADRVRARLGTLPTPLDRFRQEDVGRRVDGGPHAPLARRYLEESAAPRFYRSADRGAREALVRAVGRFSGRMDEAMAEGRRLASGKVSLLGLGQVDIGTDPAWHRDPFSGAVWERRLWADYDLLADDNPGDPKVIHELNRHQHLPRLGRAWYLTGEESFAAAALAQMDSWIDQNPPAMGVNWSSSLEIALRSLSWMWTIFLLLGSATLDESRARRILGALFLQLDHVERYPSTYTSPNTHLIGEAAALFIAGVTFGDLRGAAAWRRTGGRILLREIERQTLDGGVHAELSSYYHCYSLDFFLQALILARRNGIRVPSAACRRLAGKLEFLMQLTRPDGTLPLLGDDDGGRALALSAPDYRSFADGLCTGAVVYGRGDWKWAADAFHEETLWLLGPEALRRWKELPAAPPGRLGGDYPEAGYFVRRTGWGGEDSHLVLDCGGLGRIGGGHGHADALSLVLAGPGGEVLVDPGTYVYNLDRRWRDHFRSTRAHNTVVVDGCPQSRPGKTFGWLSEASTRVTGSFSGPDLEFLEGEHDGYRVLSDPAVHRRRVLQVGRDYWVVFDDVRGGGSHEIELAWQLAPERWPLRVGDDGGTMVEVVDEGAASSFGLYACGSSPVDLEIARGEHQPPGGWVSRRYGHKEPAPALRLRMRSTLPAGYLTVLSCGAAGSRCRPPLRAFRRGDRGDIAVIVRNGDTTDRVLLGLSGAEMRLGRLRARGEVFWVRTRRGRPERVFARNASHLAVGGLVLLDRRVPYLCWPASLEGRVDTPA